MLDAATDELVQLVTTSARDETLSERVSVIFGGGRGIGAELARRLAEQGDAVVIADRAGDDHRLGYRPSPPLRNWKLRLVARVLRQAMRMPVSVQWSPTSPTRVRWPMS